MQDAETPFLRRDGVFLFGVATKGKEFCKGSKILNGVDHEKRRKQSD